MGLMLQVTWQLMNLFIIAVAILIPGSSGYSEPLSLESSSPIPSIEAQVPNSILEQNGSIVQPPTVSPSIKSLLVHQIVKGPPPFLSPRQSTTLPPQHNLSTSTPTQTPHGSDPLSSAEPPTYSAYPAAMAPQDSTLPPVAKLSHDLAPSLPATEPPHYSTAPPSAEPSYNSTLIPSAEPPHVSVTLAAKPPVTIPQLPIAEPPEALPLPSPSPPPEVSQHSSTMQSPPTSVVEAPVISTPPTVLAPSHSSPQPLNAKPPHSSVLPLAAKPPDPKPPLPVAETPHASVFPPTIKPPVAMPQFPTVQPPKALPLAFPSPPPEVSQHTSTMQSPPIPAAEVPVNLTPPTVLAPSHASAQPPVAMPPHGSALPVAAKPPYSKPPLPVAEPPHALPPGVVPQPPTAEPSPEALPLESPSPPPEISQQTPTIQSPPIPAAEAPVNSSPEIVLAPTHALPQPPVARPPHSSALPLAANPPVHSPPLPVAEPPQELNSIPPTEASPVLPFVPPAMPPHPLDMQPPPAPLNASSPPPQLGMPNASSPLPQLMPPYLPSSPPQPVPPYTLSPPPQLVSPDAPPPTSTVPSNASLFPPSMAPPSTEPPTTLPSPSPLPPNFLSPPPQLVPPIPSLPPPQLIPSNVSSPPPELIPPIASSPPSQLIPPIASSPPPQLIPPMASSPPLQLIPPPASPPTSVLPSNASVSPPFMMPPPDLPLPPPAAPPHASAMLSPPMPSHAPPPLPHLVPSHSSSPPYVLPAPPPLELPHISPPRSSIVPGSVSPHASPPSPFLAPPLAPASPAIPSHSLSTPPPSEPSYSTVPPSPATQQTVPAAPPHSSQRKETQEGAPPPSSTSPERSPSSRSLPEGAPPAHQVTPRSVPPISHQTEAPKQAPISRPNASEPDTSPSSAPPPRNNPISGRYSSMAPPGRAPDQSPEDKLSPHHAPSEPKLERHSATAPAPYPFSTYPESNRSHHSLRHSPVKGSPTDMAPFPSPPGIPEITPAPSPLQRAPPGQSEIPFLSPKISPSGSSTRKTRRHLAPPIRSLPPPPPNADCAYLTCPEPFTNTPPGSPCGCVWPMQVGLRLSVALYTFFPLVSELAREISAGVFMKQSQVRVMGANAASQESDKTIVLVDLVPLDEKFDNITAFLTFQRFWHKQVVIDKFIFGDYDVLYVRYPGLPASPPMAPADIAVINGMPYSVQDPNQSKVHPLGVDVTKQKHKQRLSGIVIAAIVFSAIVCVLICCSVAWVLLFRHTNRDPLPALTPRALPSLARSSGPTGNSIGSGPSSLSVGSSLATYTGSAKTFSASEIEKATDSFSPSRIVGEGGFGLVYSGVLEDETNVAVKVLKRDDQQGGREFLAEVEMLSRLHHRNLVKLIGICTDERLRCLVYELIPNGSVESHLHDKETAPLDWASRMKIALGAARGLAYLHEDSSPRVIHRDFKSSNILLENDFTPKVSDFGLARSAMDEGNQHISTRVMGTFGYVAPEYAMTGHLLVKSDVYSYGVVLLELLTGRKPVDMSQPPGQENLASWTRPFLTTKEGLELILDPSLGSDVSLDSAAKVAAIASMCVQPEVSHRPFMGEVVQALKLVCDECDDSKDGNSRHGSHENLSADFDDKASPVSEARDYLPSQFSLQNYHSALDVEKGISVSENFSASARANRQTSDSFRRHSASGPLKTTRGRNFWQRIRLSNGSVSEHGLYRLWAGSH